MIPKVMENCWRATRLPRTSGGASSALRRIVRPYVGATVRRRTYLYRGTAILRAPTPRPVINRPKVDHGERM